MSKRSPDLYLEDILEAIARIMQYTEDMDLDSFISDEKTRDAVERNFITIGEAASNVPNEIQIAKPEIPWRLMKDMRNFAVHSYWGVTPEVLWNTVKKDLPQLLLELGK